MNQELLRLFARKYVWWKSPDEALAFPQHVIAQVMNIGDYSDVQLLSRTLGVEPLREAIRRAEAGQFTPRSWSYWHYRLGLAEFGQVPAVPRRRFH